MVAEGSKRVARVCQQSQLFNYMQLINFLEVPKTHYYFLRITVTCLRFVEN